jgi:phospholipid transport system transporter-binding protein
VSITSTSSLEKTRASLLSINSHQAELSGCLDRLVGKQLLEQGRGLIETAGSEWKVDLAGVTRSSSVGIALLIDWKRYGKNKNVEIDFLNVPDKMRQVIEFSGLSTVFDQK